MHPPTRRKRTPTHTHHQHHALQAPVLVRTRGRSLGAAARSAARRTRHAFCARFPSWRPRWAVPPWPAGCKRPCLRRHDGTVRPAAAAAAAVTATWEGKAPGTGPECAAWSPTGWAHLEQVILDRSPRFDCQTIRFTKLKMEFHAQIKNYSSRVCGTGASCGLKVLSYGANFRCGPGGKAAAGRTWAANFAIGF